MYEIAMGVATLLADTALRLVFILALPSLVRITGETVPTIRVVNVVSGLLLAAIFSTGLVLLVAALVTAREPAPPPPSVPADGL